MDNEICKPKLTDYLDLIVSSKKGRIMPTEFWKRYFYRCYACGNKNKPVFTQIINDDLANVWCLDRKQRHLFDIRESTSCDNCGSSLRSSLQARAICSVLSPRSTSLTEAVSSEEVERLKIAEINFCGALHNIIKNLPNLHYSEYRPDDKTIRQEDLNALSYKDNSFDLVITSETIEHVPDWEVALREIRRVLKPGGFHIFTVPAIMSRRTKTKAKIEKGKIINIEEPSYHGCNRSKTDDYLVFTEFGIDFRKKIDNIGYSTALYYRPIFSLNDPNLVYVSKKSMVKGQ